MKTPNLSFFLALTFVLLSACSKEKRIEKHLYRNGGEWMITKYTVQTYYMGIQFESEGVANAGKMVFSKDGSMVWTETLSDTTQVYNCTWSNTKEELKIVRDGVAYPFLIDSESKTEMQIRYSEDHYEDGEAYQLRTVLKLER